MKLIDSFSATTRLNPSSGYVYEKLVPLPFSDFIILNTENEDQNLNYVFWNRVIQLITPALEKENISIIQFIEKKKFNFDHIIIDKNYSIQEKAYLIKRAKLLCGSSKLYSVIASEFGTKQCFLKCDYSIDNDLASSDEIIHSNSERKSFVNPVGNYINNIRPEEIANFILKKICKTEIEKFDSTLAIGKVYAIPSIDLIPDCNFKIPNSNVKNEIIVRMDYEFDETNLQAQLINSPCSIVTNKSISKEIIQKLKSRIKKVFFKVEKNSDSSFLDELDRLNINYDIITNLSQEDLKQEKIKFFNHKKINKLNLVNLDFLQGINQDKVYFKTNKIIIKSGNTFPTRWHAKNNMPHKDIRNQNFKLPPILDDSFREEAENFYFLTSEEI
jgi:peptidyl-tRNA hydrolase